MYCIHERWTLVTTYMPIQHHNPEDHHQHFHCCENFKSQIIVLCFQVWSCGLNSHHQLGHSPPPPSLLLPRQLTPCSVHAAGDSVLGICASHYHTVIWGQRAVLTCGLNAGQLGHSKGPSCTIILPRPVSPVWKECDYRALHLTLTVERTTSKNKKKGGLCVVILFSYNTLFLFIFFVYFLIESI